MANEYQITSSRNRFCAWLDILPSSGAKDSPSPCYYAVIYAPLPKVSKEEVSVASDVFSAKELPLRYVLFVRKCDDTYGVWFGYLTEDEARCVAESGVAKLLWLGSSAKEAWEAVYTVSWISPQVRRHVRVPLPMSALEGFSQHHDVTAQI